MSPKGLTKEAILKADDLEKKEEYIQEWGGSVFVRVMTIKERQALQAEISANKGSGLPDNFMEKLVSICLCNDTGERLFDGPDDIVLLSRKSSNAITKVFAAAAELNGMTEQGLDKIEGE